MNNQIDSYQISRYACTILLNVITSITEDDVSVPHVHGQFGRLILHILCLFILPLRVANPIQNDIIIDYLSLDELLQCV